MNTQAQDLEAVVERLKEVEGQCRALAKQNRGLKAAGVLALVVVVVIIYARTARTTIITPASKFQSLKAERLEIADGNGTTRLEGGSLSMHQQGDEEPSITIYDEDGNVIWRTTPGGATPLEGPERAQDRLPRTDDEEHGGA